MTDCMVERVARAIDAASQPPGRPDYKILMENCARAALEAMRDPTSAMVEAGASGSGEDSEAVALGAWQAMIDEALKP